jgi:hypothetical protein
MVCILHSEASCFLLFVYMYSARELASSYTRFIQRTYFYITHITFITMQVFIHTMHIYCSQYAYMCSHGMMLLYSWQDSYRILCDHSQYVSELSQISNKSSVRYLFSNNVISTYYINKEHVHKY